VVVIRDITERKRAEEDLRRLTTAIEQSGEIVMMTDTQGIIRYVNPLLQLSPAIRGRKRSDRLRGF
jgi:PAS domain-containing protein